MVAVEEARWTYRQLGVGGRARRGEVAEHLHLAAVTVSSRPKCSTNSSDEGENQDRERLLDAAAQGGRARHRADRSRHCTVVGRVAARFAPMGGRSDEWRLPIELPPLLQKFDRAAGLNHRELTFRSLFV